MAWCFLSICVWIQLVLRILLDAGRDNHDNSDQKLDERKSSHLAKI